jgi:parallel beta-helix repeat protein
MKTAIVVGLVAVVLAGCAGRPPSAERSSQSPTDSPAAGGSSVELPCLASGDQNTIYARLQGPGDVAVLCPGAVFELTASIIITADRQQIYTEGLPKDDTRATLRIVAPDVTTAVLMRDRNAAVLRSVIVDGGRITLGPMPGPAMIYAGGSSDGQIIRDNKIMNTRSWTSLHIMEGPSDSEPCQNALVEGNEIGPAGISSDSDWAHGMSLACTRSFVRGNVITDATGAGIFVYSATGSVIEDNTVRAETQTLLGGISMVDGSVSGGDFAGTIVRNNVIDASGAVIRTGLAMGNRVWVCLPPDAVIAPLRGATVTGNILRGDNMQYGFAVAGVSDWTVTGNIDEAQHSGAPSVDCNGQVASPPAGFLFDPAHSQGVFQPEFTPGVLDFALWAIVPPPPGQ